MGNQPVNIYTTLVVRTPPARDAIPFLPHGPPPLLYFMNDHPHHLGFEPRKPKSSRLLGRAAALTAFCRYHAARQQTPQPDCRLAASSITRIRTRFRRAVNATAAIASSR